MHDPCAADLFARAGALAQKLPSLHDPEGPRLPESLPPVVDTHVHLFPDNVFDALWRWFGEHGWDVRYPLYAPAVLDFLFARGVEHVVALHYAHRPGMARDLNRFVAGLAASDPRITGLATVLPGEPDAVSVLEEAFDLGLKGVKLHCHVQCFAVDDDALQPLFALCASRGLPMVVHAGREPKSPAYACDPHLLCSADRVDRALRDHPDLTLVVPHLGADEFDAYDALLDRHEHLWLDSTMMAADFFAGFDDAALALVRKRWDRVLYGTDFPNLPYAWDREVRRLVDLGLPEDRLAAVLGGNAARVWGL
ncbi:MAG: amidohydrolase [Alphaproteobacteria bacterium]|nr:amidohydrolase [Alphaproteobacteria bacterium]